LTDFDYDDWREAVQELHGMLARRVGDLDSTLQAYHKERARLAEQGVPLLRPRREEL
jgi:hypothetical protein